MTSRPLVPLVLVAGLLLGACGGRDAATSTAAASAGGASAPAASASAPAASASAQAASSPAAAGRGAYVDYATHAANPKAHAGNATVLFFHAPWCPDCRVTDASLLGEGVPDGLTVVKVDYDSMTDLKKTYGITQQHTFVAIDAEGKQVAKWSGSRSGAAIKAKAKAGP